MDEDIKLNYVLPIPNLNVNRVSCIYVWPSNNAIALKRVIVKIGQVSDISVWKVANLMHQLLLSTALHLQLLHPLQQQVAVNACPDCYFSLVTRL